MCKRDRRSSIDLGPTVSSLGKRDETEGREKRKEEEKKRREESSSYSRTSGTQGVFPFFCVL